MEVVNDGLTVMVDLRGQGEAWKVVSEAAAMLDVKAGILFEMISLAAVASCQVRFVAGVKMLVTTMIVRNTSRDVSPVVEEGNMVIGKVMLFTPMNRVYASSSAMTVNHVLPSVEEATEFYLGMVRQMEDEVTVRAPRRKSKSSGNGGSHDRR